MEAEEGAVHSWKQQHCLRYFLTVEFWVALYSVVKAAEAADQQHAHSEAAEHHVS